MVNSANFKRGFVKRVQTVSFALGFEARRLPRITRRQRLPRSNEDSAPGWVIEVIGPSAVGKSTFLTYLRETSAPEDEFLVLPRKFRVQRRSLSKNRWTESDRRWLDLWTLHQAVRGRDWIHPCDLDVEDSKVLRDERTIRTYESLRPLVVDHSLALFFNKALRSCAVDDEDLFDDLMSRRVVVVCLAEPTTVLERIHQRAVRGVTRAAHIGRSDEELLERIRMSLRSWSDYGELLASRGVPVLVLDLDADFDLPKRKLRDFVRSLA